MEGAAPRGEMVEGRKRGCRGWRQRRGGGPVATVALLEVRRGVGLERGARLGRVCAAGARRSVGRGRPAAAAGAGGPGRVEVAVEVTPAASWERRGGGG